MAAGKIECNWKRGGQLLLGCVLATQVFAPAVPGANDECEWQFLMHQHEAGNFKVSMAKHSVKIASANGLIGLANAPNWEVVRYRLAEKVEWRAKMSAIWG